ncbi:hypothetical protein HZU38_30865 (plasmid) [Mycolicibacterium vanbaalenii]|uniref:DUF6551 family protein n=1 Tax=Mycolicibacterium vanbaalenii TaxID=110539 RepID=UPI001F31B767|nr:DUF6551 family protein [Mycolicibacterium vanbaalenii]UJL32185.1 hypothetical protein HZU38_30865 [Mycolicibacterium vanbaalenii]WND60064.1 hypothetical protein QQA43_30930 [Mycolicibacterium vanbaalenii]
MTSSVVEVSTAAVTARGSFIDALCVEELFVDPSYQRPTDMGRARTLAAAWDRRLAGVIEVSDRGEQQHPRYAVIDGAHRVEGARLRDPQSMVVASIHEGLSIAEEAALFDRLNRQRRRPSTWDHWRARKVSGDATVTAIEAVVSELGLRIDPGPREGNVRCTATLEKLAALGGTDLVRETLQLILSVWDLRTDAYDAPIVHGVGLIQHHLRERIDPERLADTLLGVVPLALRTQAAALGDTLTGTAGVRMATTIMVLYNKNRRVLGRPVLVSARSFGGGARNARSRPLPSKTA